MSHNLRVSLLDGSPERRDRRVVTARCGRFVVVMSAVIALAGASMVDAPALSSDPIQGQGNRVGLEQDVQNLAGDATQGRDNDTAGSLLAQNYLISQLKQFAVGADASKSGDDAFEQPIPGGTNIIGLIPGGALANADVIVGAHYDHLGSNCRTSDPADNICNGATDNAAGVANVLSIGREIAQRPGAPRRSVILALWDREEDGLLGSEYYVQQPVVPLAQTVAYVNFDNQGQNLLPSVRRATFAIGTETGGAQLESIVHSAVKRGPLDTGLLSVIFGQGRSDHATFVDAHVPAVFFTDATGPCYHTAQDEIGIVDFWKLRFEAKSGLDTVTGLIDGDRPTFVGSTPLATFADAVVIAQLMNTGAVDLGRFSAAQQAVLVQFRDDLNAIVAAGADNFGPDDVNTILIGAANLVSILATGTCDGFLKGPA